MAEGNGLLNRHRAKSLVAGSNPALSAIQVVMSVLVVSAESIVTESIEGRI